MTLFGQERSPWKLQWQRRIPQKSSQTKLPISHNMTPMCFNGQEKYHEYLKCLDRQRRCGPFKKELVTLLLAQHRLVRVFANERFCFCDPMPKSNRLKDKRHSLQLKQLS